MIRLVTFPFLSSVTLPVPSLTLRLFHVPSFLSHPPCFPIPPPTPPRRIRVVVRHVHARCLITSPPPVPPSSHLPELEHIHHFLQPQLIRPPPPPLPSVGGPLLCSTVTKSSQKLILTTPVEDHGGAVPA